MYNAKRRLVLIYYFGDKFINTCVYFSGELNDGAHIKRKQFSWSHIIVSCQEECISGVKYLANFCSASIPPPKLSLNLGTKIWGRVTWELWLETHTQVGSTDSKEITEMQSHLLGRDYRMPAGSLKHYQEIKLHDFHESWKWHILCQRVSKVNP